MLRIGCVCVDTGNPEQLARFWADALAWTLTIDDDGDVVLAAPDGSPEHDVSPDLLFLRDPNPKGGKNRLHLDLRPDDQAAEVTRLKGLGATLVDIGQGDVSWVVMADPEGNEFCVLRADPAPELAREE